MGAPAGSGRRWATSLMVGAAVSLCGLSLASGASAVTLRRAEAIALRILHPARVHAVVYRWGSVLSARSIINEPGPGGLQGGRTRVEGSALVTPLARRRIGHRAFMFWEDLLPTAALPHPNVLLVLDAGTGRVLRHTSIAWWPIVNGKRTAWSARAERAPRVTAYAPTATGSRVIELGDFSAPDSVPDFNAVSTWALQTTGKPAVRAGNLGGLQYAIDTSYADGARDVVIYLSGHQFVPIGFVDLIGRAGDTFTHLFAGKPPGPYVSTQSGPDIGGHTWKTAILTAEELKGAIAAAKQRHPDLTVTVVVETCGSGNFGPALRGSADQIITSVTSGRFTLAPPRAGGASPFTTALTDATASALNLDPGLSLSGAIQSAGPAIGRIAAALGARQDGGTYPQDPTYTTSSVSGQILSRAPCNPKYAFLQQENPLYCTPPAGQIAVDVALGFSVGEGVGGTVTISPPGTVVDSSKPPPPIANPFYGDVFFYARAGTTVKLTANHGPGAYLDGWQVQNGARCVPPNGTPSDHIGGGSPGSCSFTVNDPYGLHTLRYQAIAFFLKCPPPGQYLGLRQGELIDCPGVTEAP